MHRLSLQYKITRQHDTVVKVRAHGHSVLVEAENRTHLCPKDMWPKDMWPKEFIPSRVPLGAEAIRRRIHSVLSLRKDSAGDV